MWHGCAMVNSQYPIRPAGLQFFQTSAGNSNLRGFATDGSGKLVLTGGDGSGFSSGGRIMWSTNNGANWVDADISAVANMDNNWRDCAYGAGVFVAVGINGRRVIVSDDGETWVAPTSIDGNPIDWLTVYFAAASAVCWDGTQFIVTTGDNSTPFYVSADGYVWTTMALPAATDFPDIASAAGTTIAMTGNATVAYRTTNGGASWSSVTLPAGGGGGSHSIATNGTGTWIRASNDDHVNSIARSTNDGVSWSAITLSSPLSGYGWMDIKYGNGRWVVVGYDDSTGEGRCAESTDDGLTWTEIPDSHPLYVEAYYTGVGYDPDSEKFFISIDDTGGTHPEYVLRFSPGLIPGGDIFQYSVDLIADLGFSTTMSYANSGFEQDYHQQVWGNSPTDFMTLLQSDPYVYLFEDSGLNRHVFQVWTFANGPASQPPARDVTVAQLVNEYTEIYNAVVYLLETYSGKEFIIKNWEGDWQLLNGFDPFVNIPSYRAQRYAAWASVRQKAVRDAVRDTPSTSTAFYCVEINRCLDDHGYRLHRDVINLVKPDMIGWSAYEAINDWIGGWERDARSAGFATGTNDVRGFAYGNGVFLVYGTNGEISRSLDGKLWVAQTNPFSGDVNGIVWDNTLQMFMACGAGGAIATSPTGVTWTSRSSGTSEDLNGIITDNFGNAVIFGDNNVLLWTFDGTSWSTVTYIGGVPPGTDYTCAWMDQANSLYMAAGTNGKAVYGSGPVALPLTTGSSDTWRSISSNGSIFVAGGDNGKIGTYSVFGGGSFTLRTSQFSSDAILSLAYGQGKFVAVGTSGKISTSTDGTTWVARTSGTGAYLRVVNYSSTEDAWMYGCDGATGYSLDGEEWIVNGQGALGGAIIYHALSVDGWTVTGSDNNLLTTAKFWHVQKACESNTDRLLRKGFARIRNIVDPNTPIIISEYGYPQDQSNFTGIGLDVGRLIDQVVETALDIGATGLIYWQILDNEEQSPGVPRGFHLYERDGDNSVVTTLSPAGVKYASILST